jgi:hypothetical protein
MNRYQQGQSNAEPQNPAANSKDRHVNVIEDEHLVAQNGQAVQNLGPLVMLDSDYRGLQSRYQRLQRDGYLFAEPALGAVADYAQKPRARHRST